MNYNILIHEDEKLYSGEIRKSFRYCGIHLHMNAEGPGEIAVDTSQLHSVLRTMIESGALIQNYVDTTTDDELLKMSGESLSISPEAI